jgi:hypothetical protein
MNIKSIFKLLDKVEVLCAISVYVPSIISVPVSRNLSHLQKEPQQRKGTALGIDSNIQFQNLKQISSK